MLDINELRRITRERHNISHVTVDVEEERNRRGDYPVTQSDIKWLAKGEYELIGATRDDAENNPKRMRRFDREIITFRQNHGACNMPGGFK